MFCNKCGSMVADNSTVCPVCGNPMGAAPMGGNPNPYAQTTGPVYNPNAVYGGMSQKSKIAAGLLAIFLGCWGVHNFYLGYTKNGLIQLLVALIGGALTFGVATLAIWIWAIVDAVNIFSGKMPDANGLPLAD